MRDFYVIHRNVDGLVVQSGSADVTHLEVAPDQTMVVGAYGRAGETYVSGGVVKDLPPKPGTWASFDLGSEAWIDARTPSELAAALVVCKQAAVARINTWAATERGKYITSIPGQDMIYLAKEAEAIRYLADVDPQLLAYPLISAEIGITADTSHEIAQLWVNLSEVWRGVAAQIEQVRLSLIQNIQEASSEAVVNTINPPSN